MAIKNINTTKIQNILKRGVGKTLDPPSTAKFMNEYKFGQWSLFKASFHLGFVQNYGLFNLDLAWKIAENSQNPHIMCSAHKNMRRGALENFQMAFYTFHGIFWQFLGANSTVFHPSSKWLGTWDEFSLLALSSKTFQVPLILILQLP